MTPYELGYNRTMKTAGIFGAVRNFIKSNPTEFVTNETLGLTGRRMDQLGLMPLFYRHLDGPEFSFRKLTKELLPQLSPTNDKMYNAFIQPLPEGIQHGGIAEYIKGLSSGDKRFMRRMANRTVGAFDGFTGGEVSRHFNKDPGGFDRAFREGFPALDTPGRENASNLLSSFLGDSSNTSAYDKVFKGMDNAPSPAEAASYVAKLKSGTLPLPTFGTKTSSIGRRLRSIADLPGNLSGTYRAFNVPSHMMGDVNTIFDQEVARDALLESLKNTGLGGLATGAVGAGAYGAYNHFSEPEEESSGPIDFLRKKMR